MRFYGFSHCEVESMDSVTFMEYVAGMGKIEAHERMVLINASTYPHAKGETQTKIMRDLQTQARLEDNIDVMSAEEFAKGVMGWQKK